MIVVNSMIALPRARCSRGERGKKGKERKGKRRKERRSNEKFQGISREDDGKVFAGRPWSRK